ncbi:CE1759 family FMN reductase [Mobilicoccus caccae]|uniref:FMN reductase n=1 Tax=Mobilicoccus caccae TaxID=1859295 RepID=A0ABQ6IVJ5_9MICO|nr:CE1759 family FMN reductase [Mobilicoccus caccae]GMA40739.1 FMN reductase [Mobilicoccus caccae]
MTHALTVVSAGLRSPSSTRMLADRLAQAARVALSRTGDDVEVRVVEVRDHAHAVVDALLTGFPTGALRDALHDVTSADALVVVTPTFQASYSGLFKSFMDLVEEGTLRGMPVILGATGGTERHSLVIEHALRPLFSHLRAAPVATGVYAATSDFGEGSDALEVRVSRAAEDLADLVLGRAARVDAGARARAGAGAVSERAGTAGGDVADVTPFEQLLARSGASA